MTVHTRKSKGACHRHDPSVAAEYSALSTLVYIVVGGEQIEN